jgi:hypothetical protein
MEISFDRRTVSECLQQRFVLPTYQREYKWEAKHLQELLTDVQEAFLDRYDGSHGRQEVATYAPYFLGTIITTSSSQGEKAIVDGQQRLTTLVMLLSYFNRLSKLDASLNVSDIAPLLQRNVFGNVKFNLDLSVPRTQLFKLLAGIDLVSDGDLATSVDGIAELDDGSRRIFDLYQKIEDLLNTEIRNSLLPHFVDYLTQRVYLFEIGVPGEQDGHKVFVTMNDRGLKLSPIDLLKGYLLSNIRDSGQNAAAHAKWSECVDRLRQLGSDEDSQFFKTWLRAQYARDSRGKSRGAPPVDFELIGDSYHRWVMDNRVLLGLANSDDFYEFVATKIPFFIERYISIKKAEQTFDPAFPHIFYNGARDLTLQAMVLMSAVKPGDSAGEISKKLRIASCFLDYFAVSRIVTGRDNTYDNVKDPLFLYARDMRGKSAADLAKMLADAIGLLGDVSVNVRDCSYSEIKRHELLHLLARLADHLDGLVDSPSGVGFPSYVDRTRANRTYDIEHVLPAAWAGSDKAKQDLRNNIGSLILLTRGRNRSLKDAVYGEKLSKYISEGILAQTLCSDYYKNNPALTAITAAYGVAAIPSFDIAANAARTEVYSKVAAAVWNAKNVSDLAVTPTTTAD